jgi:hypothetical protein
MKTSDEKEILAIEKGTHERNERLEQTLNRSDPHRGTAPTDRSTKKSKRSKKGSLI